MAKGKTATATVVVRNMPATTVSRTVELVVKNDMLVVDTDDSNQGVDSRFQ